MSENPNNAQAGGQQEAPQQQVAIHGIYIKDVSFEAPSGPMILQGQQGQPQVEINLGLNTSPVGENLHEVVLSVTVTAKFEDKTAFLAEVHQGGVFGLHGFSQEELGPVLGIYCPNTLFPFAREAVASLVGKGGFPSLMIEPVNFEAMYFQHLQQGQQPAGNA